MWNDWWFIFTSSNRFSPVSASFAEGYREPPGKCHSSYLLPLAISACLDWQFSASPSVPNCPFWWSHKILQKRVFDVLGSIRNGEGTALFWAYMVSCRRMRNGYHEGLSLDSFLRSGANWLLQWALQQQFLKPQDIYETGWEVNSLSATGQWIVIGSLTVVLVAKGALAALRYHSV